MIIIVLKNLPMDPILSQHHPTMFFRHFNNIILSYDVL